MNSLLHSEEASIISILLLLLLLCVCVCLSIHKLPESEVKTCIHTWSVNQDTPSSWFLFSPQMFEAKVFWFI